LSRGTTRSETLDPLLLQNYLGGRGLAVRLLRAAYRSDPFDPDLPLIFAVGPLCGTAAPTAARLSVVSRSPLSGTISDSSCGGTFAWQLKAAGFDALRIVGRSARPVVLEIAGQQIALRSARHLWGKGVADTLTALGGSGSAAVIGPAGENRVRYANIMTSAGNAAGRGGLGAVMGGKQLKGIRIDGATATAVADPGRLQRGIEDVMRLLRASPVVFGRLGLAEFGSAALVDLLAQRRMVPTENFRHTWFAGTGNYAAAALRRHYQPLKQGCHDCPIACKKATADGVRLPEHDSLSHFGALLGISDLAAIVAAGRLCNDLGLDTISAGASLAAWGEIRGSFPAPAELPGLLRAIARRRGDGDLLAEGARRLGAALGQPHLAMTVKGLELPAYDPRGAYGMALAYCTSNRGACHLRAYPVAHEILRKPVATDRFDFAGKAWMNIAAENTNAAVDSLVACRFAFLGAGLEEYAELLNAITGLDYTAAGLTQIGERIWLTERCYNQHNGFGADDEILPQRFFTEAGSSGEGIDIPAIDRQRFTAELRRYYRLRGLDDQGRLPTNYLELQP
jgi:aldehyde:ferredoxin oxidoreductase